VRRSTAAPKRRCCWITKDTWRRAAAGRVHRQDGVVFTPKSSCLRHHAPHRHRWPGSLRGPRRLTRDGLHRGQAFFTERRPVRRSASSMGAPSAWRHDPVANCRRSISTGSGQAQCSGVAHAGIGSVLWHGGDRAVAIARTDTCIRSLEGCPRSLESCGSALEASSNRSNVGAPRALPKFNRFLGKPAPQSPIGTFAPHPGART
jgi:hypothetical protein